MKPNVSSYVRMALLGSASMLTCNVSWAIELPAAPLLNLKSEEFRNRESAQADLLAWARGQPEPAMDALYRHARVAEDPEVRERCLAVLRELVNDEYLKEGEGFLGIRMQDELANVPGDPRLRAVIRVIQVVADSAAGHAGLQANDLIAGLGDLVWHEPGISQMFSDKIRQLKPNTKVTLKVSRNGKLMDIEVSLGRRPFIANPMFPDDRPVDLEAAERAAKDANFRRWLDRKKSAK